MRILKNSTYTLPSPVFVSTDGETPTDCTGTPTCTVTREDGTSLTAATVSAAAGDGNYTAAITTTHTSQLDNLVITWTGTAGGNTQVYTDTLEVVGAHYVSIPELRAEPGLDNTAKFPTELLREVRDSYEDLIEQICGVAFVRRYARDQLDGNTFDRMYLMNRQPRALISATINGSSVSTSAFTLYDDGQVVYDNNYFPMPTTAGSRNIKLAYEHGYDAPPPALKREVVKAIRAECQSRQSTETFQVISETFDGRTLRFSTPDPSKGRYTGIITLDPVLAQVREAVGIA